MMRCVMMASSREREIIYVNFYTIRVDYNRIPLLLTLIIIEV